MAQGVPLEFVYTLVRLLNKLSLRQFETITNLKNNLTIEEKDYLIFKLSQRYRLK